MTPTQGTTRDAFTSSTVTQGSTKNSFFHLCAKGGGLEQSRQHHCRRWLWIVSKLSLRLNHCAGPHCWWWCLGLNVFAPPLRLSQIFGCCNVSNRYRYRNMCRLLRKGNRWRLLSKHLSCKHGWMSTGSALRGWFSSFQSDTLCSESTPDLAATNTVVLLVPCTQFNVRASQLWWGFPGFNWTTRRLLGAGSRPACVAQEVEQSFRQLQPALHTVVCMQERLQTLMALADPCVILLTQGNYCFVSWLSEKRSRYWPFVSWLSQSVTIHECTKCTKTRSD